MQHKTWVADQKRRNVCMENSRQNWVSVEILQQGLCGNPPYDCITQQCLVAALQITQIMLHDKISMDESMALLHTPMPYFTVAERRHRFWKMHEPGISRHSRYYSMQYSVIRNTCPPSHVKTSTTVAHIVHILLMSGIFKSCLYFGSEKAFEIQQS